MGWGEGEGGAGGREDRVGGDFRLHFSSNFYQLCVLPQNEEEEEGKSQIFLADEDWVQLLWAMLIIICFLMGTGKKKWNWQTLLDKGCSSGSVKT